MGWMRRWTPRSRRLIGAAAEHNASLETIARYEGELSSAKQAYSDAVLNVAITGGGTVLAVMATVAVCSPSLLLPTV